MRGRIVHLWVALSLFALCLPVVEAGELPQGIILIGWDGARRPAVDACLGRGELPHLQALIDRGRYVKIDLEGGADTKAAWTEILTGSLAQTTGVYSNQRYQPVPKGLSLFERLEAHFGADDFVTVAMMGKQQHLGSVEPPRQTQLEGATEDGGGTYRILPGSPYYNIYRALEVWEYGLTTDEKVGTRALELLERYRDKPFFFFVHFAEADYAGRLHGEDANEYRAALIANDVWTGRIVAKLAALGLGERTQVYVTADSSFLATTNQAVQRDGRGQDIAPTILEAFGLDLSVLKPPLDGVSLTQADHRPPMAVAAPDVQPIAVSKPVEEAPRRPDVIYVPTPQKVVDAMLRLAEVKESDVVYDLGCGDGRIVVTAAKQFGCRAFGYDIDPERIAESNENVRDNGVTDLVTIEQKDIFTLDLSGADVVTLYLLPSLNVKLIPQLEKLKPGSRIVSHDFDMRGVEPEKVLYVETDDAYRHALYLWRCPLQKVDPNDHSNDNGD